MPKQPESLPDAFEIVPNQVVVVNGRKHDNAEENCVASADNKAKVRIVASDGLTYLFDSRPNDIFFCADCNAIVNPVLLYKTPNDQVYNVCQSCEQDTVADADVSQQSTSEVLQTQFVDMFFVECPNGCGEAVQVVELSKHRAECPLEPGKCPFHELGCAFKGQRCNVQAHLQNCPLTCDNAQALRVVLDLTKKVKSLQKSQDKMKRALKKYGMEYYYVDESGDGDGSESAFEDEKTVVEGNDLESADEFEDETES